MRFLKTPKEKFEAFMAANDYIAAAKLVYQEEVTDMDFVAKVVTFAWIKLTQANELEKANRLVYIFDKHLVQTQEGQFTPKVYRKFRPSGKFCPKCIAETTDESMGDISTTNGDGTMSFPSNFVFQG
ncbi:MAG: hypothetical protein HY204_02925 [Nitrospirae bacterium]|nr:hypothetical protein [Nitrospirota bacterium]